jgi:hypothetical protein
MHARRSIILLVSIMEALWDYEPQYASQLRLRKGDLVLVLEQTNEHWTLVLGMSTKNMGSKGHVPTLYIGDRSQTASHQEEAAWASEQTSDPLSNSPSPPVRPSCSAHKGIVVEALWDFEPQNATQLRLRKGEQIEVLEEISGKFTLVHARGTDTRGIVPTTFIDAYLAQVSREALESECLEYV